MRKILNYIIFILLAVTVVFSSCNEDNYNTNSDTKLVFSLDTMMFDTIFTTIGSTTQSFRIINQYNQAILISSIRLAGGDDSHYRLNIDGEIANELVDVEVPAHDSIFVFVELTVDPNGSNQPMIVQDSIVFLTNNNEQDIDLLAWGQDFVPVRKQLIETTTWTADKPYLVYDYAYVDSGQVLTIDPGTRVYFHKNAGLYINGTIKAIGSPTDPIIFTGDRLEEMYFDIPDQWQGILLYPGNTLNEFENVEITCANIGLQVGTIENEGAAHARLHNVTIEHMAFAGLFALKSEIVATNTLVADCGYYGVTLLVGGSYDFNQCTVANYWSFNNRQSPSLLISNQLIIDTQDGKVAYRGDLDKASWKNSIIWGNLNSEIDFGYNEEAAFNYEFDHCIIKIADSVNTEDQDIYKSILKNEDPLFIDDTYYDYQLDTLSPAKDQGLKAYGELVPLDLNNVSRLSDDAPDLGAYERIENKDEEK